MRESAPFGTLAWTETRVRDGGARAEIVLRAPDGGEATVWLAGDPGEPRRSTGGYETSPADPSAAVVEGLRAVLFGPGLPRGARPRVA
jgi:hypothetical protein